MKSPPKPKERRPARKKRQPGELDPRLAEILDRMPTEPGVYLMKDKKGRIIYVGKAASLRARVRSYFNRTDTRAFVALLGRLLGDVETVVTNNEKEALLLENNLIKQHQPRFNVKLVDDKNYLVLRLDPNKRFPRLEVTRRLGQDGAKYFGPYHSASSCRATLAVVNRHFKLRTCTDHVLNSRSRPCLQYQIKRCDAPCVFPVPEPEYGKQVQDVALFLEGKDAELLDRLRERMKSAATNEHYEVAGAVRDQIRALEKTLEEQGVVSADLRDQDVFGLYREGETVEIVVLHVRAGKLLGRRSFTFTGQELPTEEVLSSFVSLYYDRGALVPDELLLPLEVEDAAVKAEWLSEKRGLRRVEVHVPQRGARAKLVELAQKNAASAFVTRKTKVADAEAALVKMQRRLNLKRVPRRIECFDISHIQGTATVGSMVVFLDGDPAKSEYRTFKVKTATNDDFASMYEVLSRRFRRARQAEEARNPDAEDADAPATGWVLPDLLVIDGGKGQLSTALAALKDARIDTGMNGIDVIALAKEREVAGTRGKAALLDPGAPAGGEGVADEGADVAAGSAEGADIAAGSGDGVAVPPPPRRGRPKRAKTDEERARDKQPDRVFLAHAKDPIQLRSNTSELFVLMRIRDEAHRFAVTFHNKLRRRRTLRSALEDVPGVGQKRKRELLRTFGSLKKIRGATVEELARAPGMTMGAAEAVVAYFRGVPDEPTAADGGGDAVTGAVDDAAAGLLAVEPPPEHAPPAPSSDPAEAQLNALLADDPNDSDTSGLPFAPGEDDEDEPPPSG